VQTPLSIISKACPTNINPINPPITSVDIQIVHPCTTHGTRNTPKIAPKIAHATAPIIEKRKTTVPIILSFTIASNPSVCNNCQTSFAELQYDLP